MKEKSSIKRKRLRELKSNGVLRKVYKLSWKSFFMVLGRITQEIHGFIKNGENPAYLVASPVYGGDVYRARDFFRGRFNCRGKSGYLVATDHLPASVEIKAVMAYDGRVLIETSKLDFTALERVLANANLPLELRGKSIVTSDGSRFITTRTQNLGPFGSPKGNMRTVITTPDHHHVEVGLAYQLLDAMYDLSCFESPEVQHEEATNISMRQDQKQTQELLQAIRQEQKPVLAVKMLQNSGWAWRRRIAKGRILRMSAREMHDFLAHQDGIETS
jgi:hypothetical protein